MSEPLPSRDELDGYTLVGWRNLLTGRFMPVTQLVSTTHREWAPVFVRRQANWGFLDA